ncbi:DUF6427 family protein [Prolixibacteraceae bacterium Z1-6]|uniref:DUF6427 family protein n=1 Tax=Draconibacterium aestuarii TaxID=2998507 RepID=A0A9X3F8T3_9BACT|nr:DUF6427 family protein [Prolixibacteraceae bacterium Z1-6]
MILKRIKTNSGLNLFLIPVAALVFWIKNLVHPGIYDFSAYDSGNILFSPIFRLIGAHPFVHVLVSMLLVVALGFLMQLVNDRYSFIRIRSKLPSVLFVIIMGGFVDLHTLHPVYFGALFVLFAIDRLFGMFEKSRPYSIVFDVGFLISVASLFYFNLVLLFPAFLFSIAVLSREKKWREFVIYIFGFLLPFVFALSYAFWTDNLLESIDMFASNIINPVNHLAANYTLQAYLGVLVFFTVVGSIDILNQYDKKKISSRKYFSAFFWIFLFSLISFIFIPAASQEMLVITAIPVTFLIANFFVFMKKKFWGELLFTLLVASVIFMQFAELVFNG